MKSANGPKRKRSRGVGPPRRRATSWKGKGDWPRIRGAGPWPPYVELLRAQDEPVYRKIFDGIVSSLRRKGGYDPGLDNPLIEDIASAAIYGRQGQSFLDARRCTTDQYCRVSDAMSKHSARLRSAMRDLAASRRERLARDSETDLTRDLKAVIHEVIYGDKKQKSKTT